MIWFEFCIFISGGGAPDFSDFRDPFGGSFHFEFRSPEDVFRDFFGTDDPFAAFFGGK